MGRRVFVWMLLAVGAAVAQAQPVRTWVSTTGVDNAECSRTNPCRTFNAAIALVAANGEVIALDSGGYGPFSIAKSATVVAAAGIHAAIAPTSGTAITVDGGAGPVVILRNLYLNSQGANFGISYLSGQSLTLENLVVSGFTQRNISIERNTVSTSWVYITDTTIRNGGGSGLYAINSAAGGAINLSLDRCRIENNAATGFYGSSNTTAVVSNTTSTQNNVGFRASPLNSGQLAQLTLERCVAAGNQTGILAGGFTGTATVRISNCTVTNNGTGVEQATAGSVHTRETSTVRGNSTNLVGTATIISGT